MTDPATPLLSVRNLTIAFPSLHVSAPAVRGINFDLGREKVGVIGESGSGKSTTGRALMRLLPKSTRITADRLTFQGEEVLGLSDKRMRQIRGHSMAMILQDPKYSLNPVMTVGEQIAETAIVHENLSRREARQRSLDMLEKVHIRDPERVMGLYPHEVSGGMGQRIMISMMLITRPALIIADEPTSALDVSVRQQVLSILDELVTANNMGLLFISHDLNLVRSFCDRVLIMYAGRIVEELPAAELDRAQHPYTRGLIEALPSLLHPKKRLAVLKRDPAWAEA